VSPKPDQNAGYFSENRQAPPANPATFRRCLSG